MTEPAVSSTFNPSRSPDSGSAVVLEVITLAVSDPSKIADLSPYNVKTSTTLVEADPPNS